MKSGNTALLPIILEYSTKSLILQDVDGQTALHCAAAKQYPKIMEKLLAFTPSSALDVENAVGVTAYETMALSDLVRRIQGIGNRTGYNRYMHHSANRLTPNTLGDESTYLSQANHEHYESELKTLRLVASDMIDLGTLKFDEKTKLKQAVLDFVARLEKNLGKAKEIEERAKARAAEALKDSSLPLATPQPLAPYPIDSADFKTAYELLKDAREVAISPSTSDGRIPRQLIHLLDVQKSVGYTFAKVDPAAADSEYADNSGQYLDSNRFRSRRFRSARRRDSDDLTGEDDSENFEERRGTMVFQYMGTEVDRL